MPGYGYGYGYAVKSSITGGGSPASTLYAVSQHNIAQLQSYSLTLSDDVSFWGDSLTQAVATGGTPWPEALENYITNTSNNEGIGGELIVSQILPRIQAAAAEQKDDITGIQGGTNDANVSTSPVYSSVITAFASAVTAIGHEKYTVSSGTFSGGALSSQSGNDREVVNASLLSTYGDRYIDYTLPLYMGKPVSDWASDELRSIALGQLPSSLRQDATHPNREGYDLIGHEMHLCAIANGGGPAHPHSQIAYVDTYAAASSAIHTVRRLGTPTAWEIISVNNGADNALFTIDGSGVIRRSATGTLTKDYYNCRVRCTSSGGAQDALIKLIRGGGEAYNGVTFKTLGALGAVDPPTFTDFTVAIGLKVSPGETTTRRMISSDQATFIDSQATGRWQWTLKDASNTVVAERPVTLAMTQHDPEEWQWFVLSYDQAAGTARSICAYINTSGAPTVRQSPAAGGTLTGNISFGEWMALGTEGVNFASTSLRDVRRVLVFDHAWDLTSSTDQAKFFNTTTMAPSIIGSNGEIDGVTPWMGFDARGPGDVMPNRWYGEAERGIWTIPWGESSEQYASAPFTGAGAFYPDYDIYVDSLSGSDANDGLTRATALQTLGAAQTAAIAAGNGVSIGLRRGSSWREQLSLDPLTGVTVAAYGAGNAPKIDASEVATGWTQPDAATYPNVWSVSWTTTMVGANYGIQAFEDGAVLANVASLAAVNSTPGRTYIATTLTGNDTIYLHTSGSDNPNTNGMVYELNKRPSAITTSTVGAETLTVEGIDTLKPGWFSGSVVTGDGASIKKTIAQDSVDHSLLIAGGSVEDSISIGASPRYGAGASVLLVAFTSTPGTYVTSVKRTGFLAGASPAPGPYEDVGGVFSHNDYPGVINDITLEQSWFVDLISAGGFRGRTIQYIAPYFLRTGGLNSSATTPAATAISYAMGQGIVSGQSGFDSVAAFTDGAFYDGPRWRLGDGFTITNTSAYGTSSSGLMQPFSTGIDNLQVNNSVLIVNTWGMAIDLANNTNYSGDYNVLASYFSGRQVRTRIGGTEYQTLAAWQAATGQDANSVYTLPADQVSGSADAFWLGVATSANNGPADGDFRINPTAKVYGGDNTPYTGTFADGVTPITDAGPQNHWDWNNRQATSGAPSAFPDVPETLAESRTYTLDPEGWDFYP